MTRRCERCESPWLDGDWRDLAKRAQLRAAMKRAADKARRNYLDCPRWGRRLPR